MSSFFVIVYFFFPQFGLLIVTKGNFYSLSQDFFVYVLINIEITFNEVVLIIYIQILLKIPMLLNAAFNLTSLSGSNLTIYFLHF